MMGTKVEVGRKLYARYAPLDTERLEAFYERLSHTGLLGLSCYESGFHPAMEAKLRKADINHADRVAEARAQYCGRIEAEIKRRGVTGIARPLAFQGRLTGDTVQEYSDLLLLAIARRHIPEYREHKPSDRGPEQSTSPSAPLDMAKLSPEKREAIRTLLIPENEDNSSGPIEDAVIITSSNGEKKPK